MNLKSLAMVGTCAVALVSGAKLMAWGTAWTPPGSNTTYFNVGGRTGQAWTPPGSNTTYFSGDLFRGFTAWTPAGSDTTYFNGNGWSGTAWTPAGGNTTYFNFRGQLAKKLFADEDFVKRIDVVALQDAIGARNVDAMTSCAWDLKGVELILGKKDKTTTSDMIFASAANLAVEQGNAEALKQIITLAPEFKKYEEQLTLKSKTRGLKKSVTALPQLMLLPQKDWEKTLSTFSDWQQPVLENYMLAGFRGITKQSADTASMLVNEGRFTMNPLLIAMGALELSKYPYDSKLGIKFEPAQFFAEAVELAVAQKDVGVLKQLSALYSTANFKTAEFTQYLADELAMLGNTRGLKTDEGKYKPGDFSPINFNHLIRTVHYEETRFPAN